jgi:ribokinase
VTKVGNDIFGKQATEGFKKENIETDYVFVDDSAPSGTALIIVDEEGENCIVVAPGANAKLLPADIDKVKNISEAAVLLMQLEIPIQTIEYIAKIAKAGRQKLIINPAPALKLEDDLLNGLYLITPNETEAYALTGMKVEDDDSASEAADIFLKKGVRNVLITMGSQGAYFQNNQLKLKVGAPVVKAIDTTAAGDVFSAALAVAITERMSWEDAMRFSVQAASISVTRMGAQSSAPFRKEII